MTLTIHHASTLTNGRPSFTAEVTRIMPGQVEVKMPRDRGGRDFRFWRRNGHQVGGGPLFVDGLELWELNRTEARAA